MRRFEKQFIKLQEWDIDPVIVFPPVVESLFQSEEEAFISDYRMKKHSFDIPWMVGITSEEGLFRTACKNKFSLKICCNKNSLTAFFNNKKLMDDMIKNWDRLLPIAFNFDYLHTDRQQEIIRELNEFYFENEPFLEFNRDNMTNVS